MAILGLLPPGLILWLEAHGHWVATILTLVLSGFCASHAALRKRDARSAAGWIGLILLVPVLGSVLYVLLGINRVRRKALELFAEEKLRVRVERDAARAQPELGPLTPLANLIAAETGRPLHPGCSVEPLFGGDRAYPAMLDAIGRAKASVTLASYHFSDDALGRRFVEALGAARARGVAVRVLFDDVGQKYFRPSARAALRRAKVKTRVFLPTLVPWRTPFINLRNHRKLLVVDGRVGFTGGMNIHEGHLRAPERRSRIRDVHFRLEGPVVADLQRAFARDWAFASRERLDSEAFFPPLSPAGDSYARGIPAGPDDDFETLRTSLLGALRCARRSVTVLSPYFLPDESLRNALTTAAMSGVSVEVLIPRASNLPPVDWACRHILPGLLERGVRVWFTPEPFDHSKLMMVDGAWTLLGSTNWDARSLRLNFEFCVECYDARLTARLERRAAALKRVSEPVEREALLGAALSVRLRNASARLLSPYL